MKTLTKEQREINETLESMGLKLTSVRVLQRNDGIAGDWDKSAIPGLLGRRFMPRFAGVLMYSPQRSNS